MNHGSCGKTLFHNFIIPLLQRRSGLLFYPYVHVCVFARTSVCLSVPNFVQFFSATVYCRCLEFKLTGCLSMSYIGIYIVLFNVNFPLYNFQTNFIKDFSTTVHHRCFKFKHTLCLSMAYVGIYFCTIKRQLPVK